MNRCSVVSIILCTCMTYCNLFLSAHVIYTTNKWRNKSVTLKSTVGGMNRNTGRSHYPSPLSIHYTTFRMLRSILGSPEQEKPWTGVRSALLSHQDGEAWLREQERLAQHTALEVLNSSLPALAKRLPRGWRQAFPGVPGGMVDNVDKQKQTRPFLT